MKSRNYEAIPGEMIMNLKTGLMGRWRESEIRFHGLR